MAYNKPTLTEIFLEVQLEPNSLPTEAFFKLVPHVSNAGFSKIDLGKTLEGPGPIVALQAPRVRCWNDDESALIQLAPDLLVANLVGEYPGWKRFLEVLTIGREAIEAGIGSFPAESISLNTVDKIVAAKDGYSLGKYLDCGGRFLPSWYQDAKEAVDVDLGRGLFAKDDFNRQLHVKVRVETAVNITIRAVFQDALQEASFDDALEELHLESNETFESLITDVTRREVMGGQS